MKNNNSINYYNISNMGRYKELWKLFNEADSILNSFCENDYKMLDNGATHCLPECIRWGMQATGELFAMERKNNIK